MKQVLKLLLSPSLLCLLLIGCSKNSSNTTPPANTANNPSTAIISGNWVISSYTQKAEDKTSQYTGFVFAFSVENKLTATKSSSVTSGTWSYSPSSEGYYGSTPTKATMNINVGTIKPLNSLTKVWNIVSSDASTLSLINSEPADDERLVFSKP